MFKGLKVKIKLGAHMFEGGVGDGGGPRLLHVLLPVKLRLLFQICEKRIRTSIIEMRKLNERGERRSNEGPAV